MKLFGIFQLFFYLSSAYENRDCEILHDRISGRVNRQDCCLQSRLGHLSHIKCSQERVTEFANCCVSVYSVPDEIVNVTSLIHLDLQVNRITTVTQLIGNLPLLSYLRLSSNEIAQLPESIGNLSSLTQLHLHQNRIIAIPESIGNLSSLNQLHLYQNRIVAIPESIGNLSSLTQLHLAQNQIVAIPESIGNLYSLTQLHLDQNQIIAIPETIGNLSSLTHLDLGYNLVAGKIPSSLAALHELQELILRNNSFWGPVPRNLMATRVCDLSGNKGLCALAGENTICTAGLPICAPSDDCSVLHNWVGPEYDMLYCCEQSHESLVCQNGRIVEVNLQNKNISGPIPEALGGFSELRVLNLAGNLLNASIPASLVRLANLTDLLLSDNDLSGSLPFLGNWSHLETLNVSNNRLGGGIPAEFDFLDKLRSLDLSNNQFTGTVSAGFLTLSDLQLFHVFENDLSGQIPTNFSGWQVESCEVHGNSRLCKEASLNSSCFHDVKDVYELPNECFGGIHDRCIGESSLEEFTCTDAGVSRQLVEDTFATATVGLLDGFYLPQESEQGFGSEAIYTSSCVNGTEEAWTGKVQINDEFGIVEVYQTPSFTSVSFLSIESFSTSSVQYACVLVNGEEVEFSAIVGGIVAGRQVTESQYDCRRFLVETVTVDSNSAVSPNSTTGISDLPPEINSGALLIAEYAIVAAYILISYAAAFVALKRRRLQRRMSDFKLFLNTSFSALFLVWGTGNLAYMVLFSLLVDESNFFYIKSVLTLTYFFTFYGFSLIIHYRMMIDGAIFLLTSLICFSYLSVTLTMEYCSGPGYGNGGICDSATESRSLSDLYQSGALILSLYGVISDFVLGLIALVSFLHVQSVSNVLEKLHGTRHMERYSRRANQILAGWALLLWIVVALVFVQKFTTAVYTDVHASAIMNNATQLLNTVQFWVAYELIRSLEFILKLGTGRKKIISYAAPDYDASDSPSSIKEEERYCDSPSSIKEEERY
ncbi:MAG: hypothetical protein SGCHY_002939 [Lobulomycetales sp.]